MKLIALALILLFPASVSPADSFPGFRSVQEKAEFQRLLKKHGLAGKVSVVYQDSKGDWFERDGKRCGFR
jgi:hypothetical protein